MLEVTIYPGKLAGEVDIPPSKSMSHRAMICAGLAEGTSNINNIGFSQDIEATCEAMRSLGIEAERQGTSLRVTGVGRPVLKKRDINCRESGSTLRFIIPIAALTGSRVVFHGEGRLVERSLEPYYRLFEEQGIKYITDQGRLPLQIDGSLAPGEFRLAGNISSQFISGLMFALPLLEGDSRITVTGRLESRPYIDMTRQVLKDFSIAVEGNGSSDYIIKGNQNYRAMDYNVEGDFSQAAFWLVAGALGSDVFCKGLSLDSLQGDKAVMRIIESMGGKLASEDGRIRALPSATTGVSIDASQYPDLVPVLAVLGALSEGRTEIINAERLRLKESDRLKAISSELLRLGADITEKKDGLVINGVKALKGGKVDSWNDHRIAMALAIAATRCEGTVTISNASCVKKSYPDFWEHYKALEGKIDERNLG
ncbi:MAG: 3-phosphoshikimate 1-carboxyvinyltransferase [Pseudomonadota bacterium]